MSLQDKTIYPSLPMSITAHVLSVAYTPTKEELEFALQKTLTAHNQLLFLVLFKLYQSLGYFIKLHLCPRIIIEHISCMLGITTPEHEDLVCYDKTSMRDRYISTIRKHFETKQYSNQIILATACKIAQTKNAVIDIINGTIEELVNDYYELPEFHILEQLAVKARSEINDAYYNKIYKRLPQNKITQYNMEVLTYDATGKSIWNKLKIEPSCPTIKNIRNFSMHLQWLQSINVSANIFTGIPYIKLECMFEEGASLDFYKIRRLKEVKKIALVAIVIKIFTSKATDDLLDMLTRLTEAMKNDSKDLLLQYKVDRMLLVDRLMEKFGEVLVAYKSPMKNTDKLKIIDGALKNESAELIAICDAYNAHNITTFIHFMEGKYKLVRKSIISILTLIEVETTETKQNLLYLLKYILNSSVSVTDIIISKDPLFDKRWLPKKWLRICKTGKGCISKIRLEIYVLLSLCEAIKSREIFVKNACKYSDYRESLVTWKEYDAKINFYQKITRMSAEPTNFCHALKIMLKESCQNAESNLEERGETTMTNGKLKLKKVTAHNKLHGLAEIDLLINAKLRTISLLDIITYSCKSLRTHDFFAPVSGLDTRLEEHLKHIVATLFCYGCNIGASESEKSIVDINRKQIGRINSSHITEISLNKAIFHVVNVYNKFQLPGYWGDGKHVSVDGTKWETYSKNLMAQYHIRYRGYGGIAYYHVSDKYIATYSNFISCGVHESRFLLDGIECNESDIKAEYVHGDNHAQSLVVYGLAYLLGIQIMPRIRNLNDLTFFKAENKESYGKIDELFDDKIINWKLIFDYTKEMFRVAISIKEGKVKPSEILTRLSANNSQNKLYMAFRELGRVVRTAYILDYISNFDLRKIVHAATCKSEEFNEYVNWIAFADDKIRQNNRLEQRKFIKYNHLVTNMVLLYNVKAITAAVNELIDEGHLVTQEILESLSPYRKSHIVRLGKFELDLNIAENPIENWEFRLGKLPVVIDQT